MSDAKLDVKSRPVEVVYDRGRDWRARIAFVLIPTDGIIFGWAGLWMSPVLNTQHG